MSKPAKNDQSEVFNSYLAKQESRFRDTLTALRAIIRSIVPDAEEVLSYQVHCFRHIYLLVGIGTNKNFVSLYTMSSSLAKKMKADLAGCKLSGTTLHFKPDEPLPVDIITKIVLARMQENEELAMAKKKK